MKKKLVLFLTTAMLVMSMAACGGNGNAADAEQEVVMAAVDVLNNVWETYGEEEMFFAMGGDMNNMVDNAPGTYSLEDAEGMAATLYVPADVMTMIDDAASLVHAMNLNTFTGAAFHVTDAANVETFVTSLKDNIMGTQWMCGFPDKLVIFTVHDQFVVSAFGNAEIMDNFKNKVTSVYGEDAVVVVEESLM